MSSFIKTRNPNQCRSHHQKMLKYYSDIPAIISSIDQLEKESKTVNEASEGSDKDKFLG